MSMKDATNLMGVRLQWRGRDILTSYVPRGFKNILLDGDRRMVDIRETPDFQGQKVHRLQVVDTGYRPGVLDPGRYQLRRIIYRLEEYDPWLQVAVYVEVAE